MVEKEASRKGTSHHHKPVFGKAGARRDAYRKSITYSIFTSRLGSTRRGQGLGTPFFHAPLLI